MTFIWQRKRERRNALASDGPIVNRARAALAHTATQFGTVTGADQTTVTVRTTDGIELTLAYDSGNYIFSRVYNLRITAALPHDADVPDGLELSFRDRGNVKYVMKKQAGGARPLGGARLAALNARVTDLLQKIDLLKSEVSGNSLSIVPMGGAYVWVLIPPVFKATAFPPGEVERIISLIGGFRSARLTTSGAS